MLAGDSFVKSFPHRSERKAATKSTRRRRPSTQYPPRKMGAQRFELSTEALDFYRRVTLSISEKKTVIFFAEKLHFYKKEQVVVSAEELDLYGRSTRQPT